ncbi:MAG: transposase [Geopsychrobacter sp.]|nr:transposase [Geopsychrobacter sp.]
MTMWANMTADLQCRKYNSDIHHRRSMRLRDYDYSRAGAYFVTICSHDRQLLFGDIDNGTMRLNRIGEIIHDQWQAIPRRFPIVELDEFVVMPNHLHCIFVLADQALSKLTETVTVGDIVGAYKSLCVHHCLQWVKKNDPNRMLGKIWQRNYWERIIRNDQEVGNIREYVQHNPTKWHSDKLFVSTL